MNKKEFCHDYCGASCINGTCPKALYNEGYDIEWVECNECYHYHGCEDCYFNGNILYPCPYDKMLNIRAHIAHLIYRLNAHLKYRVSIFASKRGKHK